MLKADLDGAITFVTYERVATTNPMGVIDAESKSRWSYYFHEGTHQKGVIDAESNSRWSCYFRALCSFQTSLYFMITGEDYKDNVE